jgi:cytoskeletal protein CcmA (bactofilin family)
MAFWNNKLDKPLDDRAPAQGAPAAPVAPNTAVTAPLAAAPAQPQEPRNPMAITPREETTSSSMGSGDLLLGAGAEFEGKLTFAGTVRIDAKFKGSIQTNDVLIVGEHAKIDADITCGTIIVHGEVNGNVRARIAIELHRGSRLRGDVESPSLTIEKGVVFQGSSKMTPAEKATSDRPSPNVKPMPGTAPSTGAGASAP